MTGSVELDQDGTSLLIRFSYREDLVAVVKDLPGRRWDPRQKVWRVPAAHVEKVYSALSRHLFDFAPEISSLRLPAPCSGPHGSSGVCMDPRAEAPWGTPRPTSPSSAS